MQNKSKQFSNNNTGTKIYRTIIIGAGAAGLYFAARSASDADFFDGENWLILEKTGKPGTKLLMSGGGQCNLTHGGSIKDFLDKYGRNGSRIRSCLYKHNNLAVCEFFESLGVELTEREDGKIFPKSMDAHSVRDALLATIENAGIKINYNCAVSNVEVCDNIYKVSTASDVYYAKNLVISTGGCSYPTSGSDGSIFKILQDSLSIEIKPPVPALVPVYVENYPFKELSGVSIKDAVITIPDEKITAKGDLLFTHKNLSGPVMLNNSRYMKTGLKLEINFVSPYNINDLTAKMKKDFSGNPKLTETWICEKFALPRRFVEVMACEVGLKGRKVSSLSGKEAEKLAELLCKWTFTISGLGSFKDAMVTSGGVSLDSVSLKTMESKIYPGLYFIGEVLDIDGDTGGYNLQFAYSSAACASSAILRTEK